MPSVKYIVIANNDRVLVEAQHDRYQTNYRDTVLRLLASVQSERSEEVFKTMQGHAFAFRLINGLWFVSVADDKFGRKMAFVVLQNAADSYMKAFPDAAQVDTVTLRSFKATLGDLISTYSSSETDDKVAVVEGHLLDLKDVVSDNINKALSNREDIDQLSSRSGKSPAPFSRRPPRAGSRPAGVGPPPRPRPGAPPPPPPFRAELLTSTSHSLRGSSKALQSRLCWNNVKMKFMLILLVLVR